MMRPMAVRDARKTININRKRGRSLSVASPLASPPCSGSVAPQALHVGDPGFWNSTVVLQWGQIRAVLIDKTDVEIKIIRKPSFSSTEFSKVYTFLPESASFFQHEKETREDIPDTPCPPRQTTPNKGMMLPDYAFNRRRIVR
jgi:hypothetical protein